MIDPTPTAGAFDGRTHLLPIRVYYEDTDFTGLVYHGSYVKFFERGRSDFLRMTGIGHAQLLSGDKPLAFVLSRLNLTYLAPARIDDAVVVRTTYDAIRGPRLLIDQAITRGDQVLCRAEVEAVVIDLDGRPRRPPRGMVEAVQPWLKPD